MKKEYFKNCLDVVDDGRGGLTPVRFTKKQLGLYSAVPMQEIRSYCSSGICLDITTDSSSIGFDYTLYRGARDWHRFDLFVDGAFVYSQGGDELLPGEYRFYAEVGPAGTTRRLTVYLPHISHVSLKNLALSPGARVSPAPEYPGTLLFYGDSITQGMSCVHPGCTYPAILSRARGARFINQGVGGYYFCADSVDPAAVPEAQAVFVAYGTNDWDICRSAGEFSAKCAEFMRALRAAHPGAPVFVITPLWRQDMGQVRPCASFGQLARAIGDICAPMDGVRVIDGLKLTPHMASFYGDAVLHPNDAGFAFMAAALMGECGFAAKGAL